MHPEAKLAAAMAMSTASSCGGRRRGLQTGARPGSASGFTPHAGGDSEARPPLEIWQVRRVAPNAHLSLMVLGVVEDPLDVLGGAARDGQ